MNGHDAFGINDSTISKMTEEQKKKTAVAAGGTAAAGGAVAVGTKLPEHSHYSHKTRAQLRKLPAGVHEVDTKMLAKKPRKLGERKQQRAYVASMAQERPTPYSPVPITRYKDGIIQRDNAHSVMANAMKGRKTLVKIVVAVGYRPRRRTGEELVRRSQAYYQQRRLKKHTKLPEKEIERLRSTYKPSSRIANTAKRPHGVVEDSFKVAQKPYKLKTALKAGKNIAVVAKADKRRHDVTAGAAGTAGAGVLASTPVRRSGNKVKLSGGQMSADDAKKVLSPGFRPGNKRAIQTMSRNMGHLENSPTTVVQYKDKKVIPFDGNHRGTARVARGDKSIPVKVVQGGERPSVSVARNAYHVGQQRVHRARMDKGSFKATATTGKHAGESKFYSSIANGSKVRSGARVDISGLKSVSGPTKQVLRARQAGTVGVGAGLLGTSAYLSHKKKASNG